jgi:hypothetical protein
MSTSSSTFDFAKVRAAGFPIYSLCRDQKRKELLELLQYDHTSVINGEHVKQTMHAQGLVWHYHPHAWSIQCGNMKTPSKIFGDDSLLRRALNNRKKMGKCKTESDLRKAVSIYSGTQRVSNFRASAAAAIHDRYLPDSGGAVWDMSAGFGGRLLGALACGKVTKYIGTDPATLTMDGLREMRDDLVPMMRLAGYVPPEVELHHIGSEDFHPDPESLSLCFTSPPYGSHERYSDEPTQSYLRFPTNEEWLHGYMRMTLDNCWTGLKQNGILAVNIAGVKSYPALDKDFVALAVSSGWQFLETLQLSLSNGPGKGKRKSEPACAQSGESTSVKRVTHKYEPIYVFVKGSRQILSIPN